MNTQFVRLNGECVVQNGAKVIWFNYTNFEYEAVLFPDNCKLAISRYELIQLGSFINDDMVAMYLAQKFKCLGDVVVIAPPNTCESLDETIYPLTCIVNF